MLLLKISSYDRTWPNCDVMHLLTVASALQLDAADELGSFASKPPPPPPLSSVNSPRLTPPSHVCCPEAISLLAPLCRRRRVEGYHEVCVPFVKLCDGCNSCRSQGLSCGHQSVQRCDSFHHRRDEHCSQDLRCIRQVLKWYQARSKPVTPVHPVCFVLCLPKGSIHLNERVGSSMRP